MKTLIAILAFATVLAHDPVRAEDAPKLKALIVTGDDVQPHDWRGTYPVVRQILEGSGKFEVKVSEEPEVLASGALGRYDLIVLCYREDDSRAPSEAAAKGLREFVAGGKGLVSIHFSVAAFRKWSGYKDLVGRIWAPKPGKQGSGHGPRGKFKVTIADKESPITAGLADFEADDELYAKLDGTKELHVLATAFSENFSKQVEPMAWTVSYEKGRVFTTVLGHDVRARQNPAFATLVARGAEWAASGKVTEAKAAAPPGEKAEKASGK